MWPLLACVGGIGTLPGDTDKEPVDSEPGHSEDTTSTAPELLGLVIDPARFELGPRDLGEARALASWSDGSSTDVSAEVSWSVDDAEVAGMWVAGELRPLGPGETTLRASWGLEASAAVTVTGVGTPLEGELVFNEILFDPASGADVNGDGNADTTEDEFVEIVNISTTTLDLEGVEVYDGDNAGWRHRFGSTVLMPGEAVVLFGMGSVTLSEPHASFAVCDDGTNGLDIGLALSNDGDEIRLELDGSRLARASYASGAASDAALVLDPELSGSSYGEHPHTGATAWSPGTLSDGSPMPGPAGIFAP